MALAVVVVAAFAVALARSRTPGCDVPAPAVQLPEQLSTVGELAQPLDTADPREIQDASLRAATALHSDLVGATPDRPVSIEPSDGAVHTAMVVPLSVVRGSTERSSVVGLVAFRLDCSGRAYFYAVRDLLHTDPGLLPASFPTIDAAAARKVIGAAAVQLVYTASPFEPSWRDPRSGRTVAAGPPPRG